LRSKFNDDGRCPGVNLSNLLSESGVHPVAVDGDAPIEAIVQDSRLAISGALFVCNPGTSSDSHAYLPDAKAKGATLAVVWSDGGFGAALALGMGAIQLPEDRIAFNDAVCRLCNTFYDYPTRSMKVVGVTGTNGKTTTAWLIRDMLAALGLRAAYLGTLGFQLPGEERELGNTTPFPVELWTLLAEARDKGVEAIAMEVSSHALAEHRCEYVEFDVGVFTNLTQDHLDFHGSMEEYEAAKLRLFTELPKQTGKKFVGAINVGDSFGEKWAKDLSRPHFSNVPVTFEVQSADGLPQRHSMQPSVRLYGKPTDVRVDHIDMEVKSPDLPNPSTGKLRVALGGAYNVENCLSAAAGLVALGFSLDGVRESLPHVRPVPGRFEAVPNDAGISILVDYAHTPDALEKLLDAVRPLTEGRVITVFGCGGDRDRTKRPKMAKAASKRSDVTVVTSDNPRTEDPQAILDEVLTGIVPGRESVDIIDRREAIAHAVKIAQPGDVVVIAGKGHENYQIIGRTKYPMDDRELAREALAAR
jgi:UDP-N-acetylmuramoyl-L-alanyl-D-glutamate--2,6-diaminopimelate ligase